MAVTTRETEPRRDAERNPAQFRVPLFLFGVGLGGLFDGIVIHQILQWHHMVSDTPDGSVHTVGGLEANTLADGLFHACAFIVILVALYLAFRTQRVDATAVLPSRRVVTGWLLVGWGVFNVVEGVIDHHVLTLHHVRDDVANPLPWDLGFLAISIVLALCGFALVRGLASPPPRASRP